MPKKNLLNVSLSMGANGGNTNKGPVSINTTMVKSSQPLQKQKQAYGIPQTTKNVVKPPSGSLASKKKSTQIDGKDVSKSHRATATHSRAKSIEKQIKVPKNSVVVSKPKVLAKTERGGVNYQTH